VEIAQTPFDKVAEEHHELNQMTQELKCFLGMPHLEVTDEDSHIWAGELAERLVRLHRKVFLHSRGEEQPGGILDELVERFPRATKTVQKLQDEHDQLLAEMRAIVAATMIFAENGLPTEFDLCGRTTRLLHNIGQHRETENDLILRVYWEDLGEAGG
jgi:hypothetical protein